MNSDINLKKYINKHKEEKRKMKKQQGKKIS